MRIILAFILSMSLASCATYIEPLELEPHAQIILSVPIYNSNYEVGTPYNYNLSGRIDNKGLFFYGSNLPKNLRILPGEMVNFELESSHMPLLTVHTCKIKFSFTPLEGRIYEIRYHMRRRVGDFPEYRCRVQVIDTSTNRAPHDYQQVSISERI